MDQPQFSPASVQEALARVRGLARPRTRQLQGRCWIEGVGHFGQAFDARLQFDTVLHSPILLKSELAAMLVRRLRASGVRTARISPEQLRSISRAERACGVGAS